jgi:hypothetical protein
MTEEYYVVRIEFFKSSDENNRVEYLKTIYPWTVLTDSGRVENLYITSYQDILKARKYKTLANTIKVVNRLSDWYESKEIDAEVKALKVEIEIKTTEI